MIAAWMVWAVIANGAIQWVEYANRHYGDDGWVSLLPMTIPFIIVAQYGLFRAFHDAPHWMVAWAFFTIGNSLLRLVLVKLTGQPVESWPHVLAGVTVMMAGAYWMKEGLA